MLTLVRIGMNNFLNSPSVSERVAQNPSFRQANIKKETLMKWFEEIYQCLDDKNFQSILNDICHVFNANTFFSLHT